MGNAVRKKELSIEDDLLAQPSSYCFEMAVKIIINGHPVHFGKEASISQSVFRTNSLNVFYLRGTDIETITQDDVGRKIVNVGRLSIAGLNSPLPTPYSEVMHFRSQAKDIAFEQFINIFNSRLLGISYRISAKKYQCLQHKHYSMVNTISCFFGKSSHIIDKSFSRLCYLFWNKEKSKTGLETILQYLFPFDVTVQECSRIKILNKNINKLGYAKLGINSDLGRYFYIQNLGISIYLSGCDYQYTKNFIMEKKQINSLKKIISQYLGNFCFYSIFLKPKNAPALDFNNFILGKTSWMSGSNFDNAKIF